ncbi:MAG: helix-turn-helix transcriptional regulator [Cyanobacteria bacterium J06634_5]
MSSWENDLSKAKKLKMFFKLCHALDCEHSEFLKSSQQSQPNKAIESIRQDICIPGHTVSPIAQLRDRRNISQEELAELVDVTPNTIQNWERDRSGAERHNMLARLCEILGCTYRDLVTSISSELSESQSINSNINDYPANTPRSYQ